MNARLPEASPVPARLALLRVTVEHGEYWDAAGRVVPLVSMLKAALTHTEPRHVGEHREFGG